jgi:hypothetical protein
VRDCCWDGLRLQVVLSHIRLGCAPYAGPYAQHTMNTSVLVQQVSGYMLHCCRLGHLVIACLHGCHHHAGIDCCNALLVLQTV